MLPLLAYPGGVDRDKRPPVALEPHVDAVARGPGNFADNHALLTRQRVDERTLSGVALAEQSDLHHRIRRRGDPELGNRIVDKSVQFLSPQPRHGADGDRFSKPELHEFTDAGGKMRRIDFVGNHAHATGVTADEVGGAAVERRDPVPNVDDEENQVGFVDRKLNLPLDVLAQIVPVDHAVPAGIHELEKRLVDVAHGRDTVARHARGRFDDAGAAAADPVEQAALADVRSANDGHNGEAA